MIEVTREVVGVLVALVVLVGWSALSNILFGHQTYFRSRGLDGHEDPEPFFDAHDAAPSSQPTPPGPHNFPQGPAPAYTQPTPPGPQISPQTPPPTYTQALSTPDRLQALLPQDLVTSEVLTILSPYDVTRALPTCQFLNQAGEQPAYWNAASVHLTAAWIGPPDTPSTAEEGEEDKKGWDLNACENPKLDFFRRMFIFPYQITEGHITRTSCRVIVKGRVYDVTPFLSSHPGGDSTLLDHAGPTDATVFFEVSNHSDIAKTMMRKYLLWDPTLCLGRAGTILGLFYTDPPPGTPTDSPLPPVPSSSSVRMPLVQTAFQIVGRQQPGLSRSLKAMLTGEESRSKRVWLGDDRRTLYMRKFLGDKRPPNIVTILQDNHF